jgi:hypothetical protein
VKSLTSTRHVYVDVPYVGPHPRSLTALFVDDIGEAKPSRLANNFIDVLGGNSLSYRRLERSKPTPAF